MGAIYLVRHGQASFGGADYDKLSDLGAEQAKAVGAELRRRGVDATQAYSGTMLRQRDTAVAAGYAVAEDARWNEYDFLDVLGGHTDPDQPITDVRGFQSALDTALLTWVAAGEGSPCAETWAGFSARIDQALDGVVASLGKGEQAVVFTSGGVIGVLAARCVDAAGSFIALHRVTCNGGITKLVTGRSGLTLVSFNEHAHLEGDGCAPLTYR